MVLYAVAIFLSAFLLFEVQPIIARILLPWFGGSAAVWTTCMLFFQTALLLGYFHGFWTRRVLTPRHRALLHIVLLASSLLVLPILPDSSWKPANGDAPTLRLIGLLARCIGLPYVLLSSTGPLFQDWFAARWPSRDPYRLFSLSNLASLLALVSYPLFVEPYLASPEQARLWSWGYGGFVVLGIGVAVDSLRARAAEHAIGMANGMVPDVPHAANTAAAGGETTITHWQIRALWLLLPACATLLLLAVSAHLVEDVATIPLLFLLPLCLYLLSFILCFARRQYYRRAIFLPLLGASLPALAWMRAANHPDVGPLVALWSVGLFASCMVLHGELARLRPVPAALTEYYLYISLGGALGGFVAGVIAPLLLPSTLELEVALLLTPVLSALALARDPVVLEAVRFRRFVWPTVYAIIATLGFVLVRNAVSDIRGYQRIDRNFYGTKKIQDSGPVTEKDAVRKLVHGSINHGVQWRDPARAREPLTYYCPASGVGLALTNHHADRPRTLGFIGLGAGTLASYGKRGDQVVFFEIDPLVTRLAHEEFTYLSGCPANVEVVLGDARLSLESRPPAGFDVLAVDAFSGDAIPVHLLTREAIALYVRHLAPDGVLAVHVSNRHLDLAPVVADAAAAVGRAALLVESEEDEDPGWCLEAHWVLVVPEAMAGDKAWSNAKRIAPRPGLRPWTDVYSNLLAVLK